MESCYRCSNARAASHGYCLSCKAAYMRGWRKTHRLTGEARRRSNVRTMARVYQQRGHIVPQPCVVCGAKAERHHPDYKVPLKVIWLCRQHHLELHKNLKLAESHG